MLPQKQLLVLSELRKNSRQHLSEIANKYSIPNSTVFDNYKLISRFIDRYVTLIDFEKLGYSLRMNFIFRMKNNEIIDFLHKQKNINSIHKINNKHTLLVDCLFRNIKEVYELKELLQDKGVRKIGMIHIIDEIKNEKFLAGSKN